MISDFERLHQASEVDIDQKLLMNGKFDLALGDMDHGSTIIKIKGQSHPNLDMKVIDYSKDSERRYFKLYSPSQIEDMVTGEDNITTYS